jgi:hypothetical protein
MYSFSFRTDSSQGLQTADRIFQLGYRQIYYTKKYSYPYQFSSESCYNCAHPETIFNYTLNKILSVFQRWGQSSTFMKQNYLTGSKSNVSFENAGNLFGFLIYFYLVYLSAPSEFYNTPCYEEKLTGYYFSEEANQK